MINRRFGPTNHKNVHWLDLGNKWSSICIAYCVQHIRLQQCNLFRCQGAEFYATQGQSQLLYRRKNSTITSRIQFQVWSVTAACLSCLRQCVTLRGSCGPLAILSVCTTSVLTTRRSPTICGIRIICILPVCWIGLGSVYSRGG
jgi:hypothetical protein